MFKRAISRITKCTFKVIVNYITYDSKVNSSCGTALIINEDKVFLTCAHMFLIFDQCRKDQVILKDPIKLAAMSTKEKNKLIIKISYYLPELNANLDLATVSKNLQKDLATFKVKENINLGDSIYFPNFNKSRKYIVGSSICRLGYPFNISKVSYTKGKGFYWNVASNENVKFPNDGIISRIVNKDTSIIEGITRNHETVESTTPGLKGQSGGAVFTKDSVVQGIQSYTSTVPLGIFGNDGAKKIAQFISLGRSVSSKEICSFLDSLNIKYYTG